AEVQLLQDFEIADTAAVTVNSDGRLNLNGFNDEFASLTVNNGVVDTAAGQLTVLGNVLVNGSDTAGDVISLDGVTPPNAGDKGAATVSFNGGTANLAYTGTFTFNGQGGADQVTVTNG